MRFDAKATLKDCQRGFIQDDDLMSELRAMTPAELDAWLAANANSFPACRELLKRLTVAVAHLLNQQEGA